MKLFQKSLVILCAFLTLAITGCQALVRITPTPTKTPRPSMTVTATNTPTGTPVPTSTATNPPAPTPTANPTNTPTMSPTDTPLPAPTDTPVPAPTDTPLPADTPPPAPTPTPVDTPTDTPVPAPSVDFKVITQRMFSMKENGGDPQQGGCGMNHTMYISVIDINGVPLDGIVVWVSGPAGQEIEIPTGEKGPGKAEFPLYGMYIVKVLRDANRDYTSETTRWLDSGQPTVEDLWNAGYCLDRSRAECTELREMGKGFLCYGHYSYEVVFQRQW